MLIYKKESSADIKAQADFILSCTQITTDILTIPNCPWTPNANPIRYWIANGQDRLGELQIRIIKFMHQNYFRFGKPVYLKARSIAARMGESTGNIGRAISALVDRGILIRLHFMMDSINRTMILPGTKEFKVFHQNNPVVRGSNVFFRKLPKRLQKSNALYNILIHFRQMYLNMIVKVQSLKAALLKKVNCYAVPFGGCKASPDGEVSLLTKLKERLKPPVKLKPPAPKHAEYLKDLLKKHDYNLVKLSVKDKNDLAELINYRMMIDIRKSYIRDLTAPNATQQKSAEKLLYMICWMFVHDIDLDIKFTDEVLTYWNTRSAGNTRTSTHKINHDGKMYTRNAVLLTYNKHRISAGIIFRAIDRLFENGYNHKYANFIKNKIKLEDVFLNVFNKKIWHTMVQGSDQDWGTYVKNDGYSLDRFPKETKKSKEMFIHIFYTNNSPKGVEFTERHSQTISMWTSRLIHSYQSQNRDIGGLGLVFPKDNGHPSVIFEFFMWYNKNRAFEVLDMQHMTSNDAWGQFIKHMRIEWNENFWKRASELVEE